MTKVAGVEQRQTKMEELLFLGGLAVEMFYKQTDTWCDFVRNFMVNIVVSSYFYNSIKNQSANSSAKNY